MAEISLLEFVRENKTISITNFFHLCSTYNTVMVDLSVNFLKNLKWHQPKGQTNLVIFIQDFNAVFILHKLHPY